MKSNILEHPVFVWSTSFLIFLSIFLFSLETLPEFGDKYTDFFYYTEFVIVIVFTVEYFYRLYLAENRLKYFFSFYAIIDLIAILPFYLSFAGNLSNLRAIRLLRLLRLLKLPRYFSAFSRFKDALYEAKEELIIFCIASLLIVYMSAVCIYHFEHPVQPEVFKSIFDCLWWSVITLTTVGYGDMYPITFGGRIFTFIILLVGLGLIAVPTGIITSTLSSVRRKEENKK